MFALMDFDPDGIAIMSTYKYGSWNLSHENANLNVPGIRWLGLRSKDLFDSSHKSESKGLVPLSSRDRKMARNMLERTAFEETGADSEWRRELQVMLMTGFKAEMEILDHREGGIEKWIEFRLVEDIARS